MSLAPPPSLPPCLTASGCQESAGWAGLSWGGSGSFETYGCYYYETGQYANKAYFGTGGSDSEMTADAPSPKLRLRCPPPPPPPPSLPPPSPSPSPSDQDSDSDGFPDAVEGTSDTDSDGIPDSLDPDSDGDGIKDAEEGTVDTDGDGTPDATDVDSDGDRIPDSAEGTADSDSDGIPDAKESNTADVDSDGLPAAEDPDSDNDGISDLAGGKSVRGRDAVDPNTPASVRQDPHIHFAQGGQADFRGRNGVVYNFFSAPRLAVNVKTEDASFRLHAGKLLVHGSFLTEAHVVAIVGGRKDLAWANASMWAAELNDDNWGWKVINGSCKRHHFQFGRWGLKQCGDLRIGMTVSTATFTLGNWSITVRGNHVYDWISGPKHRLDVSFTARGDAAARSLPHGIIGQSFSTSSPRHGRVDEYPEAGSFTTVDEYPETGTREKKKGAIEGEAALYEMLSPHSTHFAFTRFDEPESAPHKAYGALSAATVMDLPAMSIHVSGQTADT